MNTTRRLASRLDANAARNAGPRAAAALRTERAAVPQQSARAAWQSERAKINHRLAEVAELLAAKESAVGEAGPIHYGHVGDLTSARELLDRLVAELSGTPDGCAIAVQFRDGGVDVWQSEPADYAANTEGNRCRALDAAYEQARGFGVNVAGLSFSFIVEGN